MALTSLSPTFMPLGTGAVALQHLPRRNTDVAARLVEAEFNAAYDYLRSRARRLVERDEADLAVQPVQQLIEVLRESPDADERHLRDIQTALLSVLTALHIECNRPDEALVTGAEALSMLSRDPRRKDEPFMAMLAALLYDLAQVQAARGELRHAERQIEKSARILERLAKSDPGRYGPAHLTALDAVTGIYRSLQRQAAELAHAQAATSTYMDMLTDGTGDDTAMREATRNLIDSLVTQGATLTRMGRQRQAIAFYTRALKLQTKLEPELTLASLEMSIDLGEALVATPATRDKGVHLLNTMLHKATKLQAEDQHRRIVDILINVKTKRLDILGVWHKIFPK